MPAGDADAVRRFGLCATCAFGRRFRSGRDVTYVSCERSRTDPTYPRFPSIPMIRCAGWEQVKLEEPREDPGGRPNPEG
jgi:hypothetical protein